MNETKKKEKRTNNKPNQPKKNHSATQRICKGSRPRSIVRTCLDVSGRRNRGPVRPVRQWNYLGFPSSPARLSFCFSFALSVRNAECGMRPRRQRIVGYGGRRRRGDGGATYGRTPETDVGDEVGGPTYVEDLETGDVEDADELRTLLARLQRDVDAPHQPLEEAIENGLGHGAHRVQDLGRNKGTTSVGSARWRSTWRTRYLGHVTTLGDELVADFDLGLDHVVVESWAVDAEQFADAFTFLRGRPTLAFF